MRQKKNIFFIEVKCYHQLVDPKMLRYKVRARTLASDILQTISHLEIHCPFCSADRIDPSLAILYVSHLRMSLFQLQVFNRKVFKNKKEMEK
jgi:hypothetical protein